MIQDVYHVIQVQSVTRTSFVQTMQCGVHRFPSHVLKKAQLKEMALCVAKPEVAEEGDPRNLDVTRTRLWLEKSIMDDQVRERYVRILSVRRRQKRI